MMTDTIEKKSVIYPFKGKWLDALSNGSVRVFFRKRYPRLLPSRVYLYIGAPTSAIIGWSPIIEIEKMSTQNAMKLAEAGAIEESELSEYLNTSSSVGVLSISTPHLYARPLTVPEIRTVFNFYPPQNFIQITPEISDKLDFLGK